MMQVINTLNMLGIQINIYFSNIADIGVKS